MSRNIRSYQSFITNSNFSTDVKNSLLEALNLELVNEGSDSQYRALIKKNASRTNDDNQEHTNF
jgi:hypothetical protein